MKRTEKAILVTGATGRQGGAIARYLLADGWNVRALTRSPDKPAARALADRGAEVVRGDLRDRSSIQIAIQGVYGVYSVQDAWEHGVENEIAQGVLLADCASKAKVEHFVYSSVGSADKNTGIPHFESKWRIEGHIRSLNLPATILRPVSFMENFFVPDTYDAIYGGTLALGLDPDKPLQLVAVDDIGIFGALAFSHPGKWIGEALDIAGDELTGPRMAELFANAIGGNVEYVQMPIERIRTFSEDYAAMVEWFNAKGYEANIEFLRAIHPGLETLEKWLLRTEWKKREPVEPATAGGSSLRKK
ncbi:MAG: NAD(P)H-binding protein [Chitinivibrionales bacterium]|nr:NAD(P)H-binding protein [Chitinivibrionales bacterium]MBD3358032.1 NAD(P)H-binding protein [Chitinivibrionales bacterium]